MKGTLFKHVEGGKDANQAQVFARRILQKNVDNTLEVWASIETLQVSSRDGIKVAERAC